MFDVESAEVVFLVRESSGETFVCFESDVPDGVQVIAFMSFRTYMEICGYTPRAKA